MSFSRYKVNLKYFVAEGYSNILNMWRVEFYKLSTIHLEEEENLEIQLIFRYWK